MEAGQKFQRSSGLIYVVDSKGNDIAHYTSMDWEKIQKYLAAVCNEVNCPNLAVWKITFKPIVSDYDGSLKENIAQYCQEETEKYVFPKQAKEIIKMERIVGSVA